MQEVYEKMVHIYTIGTNLEQGQFSLARAVSNREIVHVVYGLIVSSRKMRKSFFGLGSGIQQTDFYSITVHQFS